MFTLKLFRRTPGTDGALQTKIMSIEHIRTMQIGNEHKAIELWAFDGNGGYQTYYVGEPEIGMEAYGKNDLHLNSEANSWWGWGLLENWKGNTSEHFRPASYG